MAGKYTLNIGGKKQEEGFEIQNAKCKIQNYTIQIRSGAKNRAALSEWACARILRIPCKQNKSSRWLFGCLAFVRPPAHPHKG